MILIENIRKKIEIDLFEFSKHAVDQSIIRRITVMELYFGALNKRELNRIKKDLSALKIAHSYLCVCGYILQGEIKNEVENCLRAQ